MARDPPLLSAVSFISHDIWIDPTIDRTSLPTPEWTSRRNRPTTEQEFKGLIDGYVKEEILYREASKLGLDQSDSIIRRRLAQKMEFLTADIVDLEEISEETLGAYYRKNSDKDRVEPKLGFRQLYFSTDKRKGDAARDANALLSSLNKGTLTFEQAIEKSDRTLLNSEFRPTAPSLISRHFEKDSVLPVPSPRSAFFLHHFANRRRELRAFRPSASARAKTVL